MYQTYTIPWVFSIHQSCLANDWLDMDNNLAESEFPSCATPLSVSFSFFSHFYDGSPSVMEGSDTRWNNQVLMLISNLQVIQPTSEIKSLRELAIREGFEDLRHGTGIVVVGVDTR